MARGAAAEVVGAAGVFDLLYSGVTGLWQAPRPERARAAAQMRPYALRESVRKVTWLQPPRTTEQSTRKHFAKTSEAHYYDGCVGVKELQIPCSVKLCRGASWLDSVAQRQHPRKIEVYIQYIYI